MKLQTTTPSLNIGTRSLSKVALKKALSLSIIASAFILPLSAEDYTFNDSSPDSRLGYIYGTPDKSFFPTLQTIDISNNNFIIQDSTNRIKGAIYGAIHNDINTELLNNTVTVKDGTVIGGGSDADSGSVFGSYSYMGKVTKNKVIIDSDSDTRRTTIKGSVYGGYSGANEVSENEVEITGISQSSSPVIEGSVYGGYAGGSETSKNNKVEVDIAEIQGDVFGGKSINGLADKNIVKISSGTIDGWVYGGYSENNLASNNEVEILNGIIKGSVYGGRSKGDTDGKVVHNTVKISAEKVGGFIYGGRSDSGSVTLNSVEISAGQVDGYVYGGFSENGLVSDNKVFISGGVLENYIYGGRSTKGLATLNSIKILDGNIKKNIYGGRSKDAKAVKNTVEILGGNIDANVRGGYSNNESAISNSIIISGGSISGDSIVGGQIRNISGLATDNIVTIKGTPSFTNAIIYGGANYDDYSDRDFTRLAKGNTLNFYSNGLSAKNIANFEFINFYLPANTKANDTMLTLTDTEDTDLSKSKVGVGVLEGDIPELLTGDRVNLIHSENANVIHPTDMTNHMDVMAGVGDIYTFELKNDEANYLYAEVLSPDTLPTPPTPEKPQTPASKQNPKVKSFLEAGLASVSFVNSGADLIADNAGTMIHTIDESDNLGAFLAVAGSDVKTKTGSYVDVKGISILTGVASSVNDTTYSAFIEAGKGEYDSFNGFANSSVVRGAGDTEYYGLGIMLHSNLANNFYIEGSLRVGKTDTEYKSGDFGIPVEFDLDRRYYGAHIGVGNIIDINNNSNLDVYAKLLYTNLESTDVVVANQKFSFDSIDSIRTKIGARYNYSISDISTLYFGAAYEREFDGKAKGYDHRGREIEAPELKGDSAVLELGANFLAIENLNLGLNLQGYLGDKEGISGGVKAEYRF
ncbi:MAG: autotransporter outer membrane beta-barrel domain-containing protein [Campylobacteraceae bacterium]|nr:autotransporter outer membrane beta-barrel domain-containing protein [Campylobacteraceae bacterium]